MGNFRDNRGNSGFGSEGRSRGTSRFGSSGGRRGGGFGGGRGGGFGGRGGGGGFGGGDREMHSATCDKCGKQCQVPFKPSGGKPVYCSDCFRKNEGGSDSRGSFSPRREERSAPSSGGGGISSEQFAQLNKKLDKILSVLEQLEIDVDEDEDGEEIDEDSEDEEEAEK